MRAPVLKRKLKLRASEYYVLEGRVFDALDKKIIDIDIIKSVISRVQYKYFSLRLEGLNFNQVAARFSVDPSGVTQACKRAVIFINLYLKKKGT